MKIYPFTLMDVISQIKAYIFSVLMGNQAVKLRYLSETQNNANQNHPQNNQLEALHLLWQNKLPEMKNTCKLKPVCLILTSDGLFMPVCVWLCLWSYCCLSVLSMHASQKRKLVKMTSQDLNCSIYIYRVTMPVHDFKFNVDATAYRKDEHQNRNVGLFFRFMSGHHIFIILLTSAKKSYAPICLSYICPPFFLIWCKFSFPYSLRLYCLCLGPPRTNDESKGNTTSNSKGKKVCTIPNKRMGKCSSEMLPICICSYRVLVKNIETLNICICLTSRIILFLTFKELLDTVLALNSQDHLELIWVEAYLFPFTGNFSLHIYIVIIVDNNEWLLYSFFLIKKIYINQILESISLIMRLFVETETAE